MHRDEVLFTPPVPSSARASSAQDRAGSLALHDSGRTPKTETLRVSVVSENWAFFTRNRDCSNHREWESPWVSRGPASLMPPDNS